MIETQEAKPTLQSMSHDEVKTLLDVTEKVPSTLLLHEMLHPDTGFLTPTNERGILFYIAGEDTPLFVPDRELVVLGRKSWDFDPTVNLLDYEGKLLGVSRHHANIAFRSGKYFIRDMGSTNGTRINNRKIPAERYIPLNDGDHIRLGQLTMIVRFISGITTPRSCDHPVKSVPQADK